MPLNVGPKREEPGENQGYCVVIHLQSYKEHTKPQIRSDQCPTLIHLC